MCTPSRPWAPVARWIRLYVEVSFRHIDGFVRLDPPQIQDMVQKLAERLPKSCWVSVVLSTLLLMLWPLAGSFWIERLIVSQPQLPLRVAYFVERRLHHHSQRSHLTA